MPIGQTLRTIKDFLPLILLLGAMFWSTSALLIAGAWARFGDNAVHWLRVELGIAELSDQLADATGANRVTFQPPGQTFVKEPVYPDADAITLVLTTRRTEAGAGCLYQSATPIFTAENGNRVAGTFQGRGLQYGTDLIRTEMKIEPPQPFLPGRYTLELQLHYMCGQVPVFELTAPAVFYVQAREG